ncbi:MAG: hypothetical protein ACI398_10880 [Clostridium sp.]
MYFATDLIKIIFITCITLFISMVFSLEIFNRKVIVPIAVVIMQVLVFSRYFYNNIILIIAALAVSGIIAVYYFGKDFRFINVNKTTYSRKKMSLLKREFIRFYNEKILFTNHILTMGMIFIFTAGYVFLEGKIDGAGYLILIMPGMITTLSVIFSIEKDVADLIKSLPINMKRLLTAKCVFLLSITIPYYVIIFVVFSAVHVEGFNFMNGTLIVFNLLLNCVIKIYLDYRKPFYEYSHMKMLLECGRRYYFYIISLVLGIPVIASDYIGIGLAFLAEFIIAAVFFLTIMKFKYSKNDMGINEIPLNRGDELNVQMFKK